MSKMDLLDFEKFLNTVDDFLMDHPPGANVDIDWDALLERRQMAEEILEYYYTLYYGSESGRMHLVRRPAPPKGWHPANPCDGSPT